MVSNFVLYFSQLPLENWVDLFGLVPRCQLVKLLPQIDDRHFAEALQYFLQKVGKITLGELSIIPPKRNNPNGRPMVENRRVDRFDLADTPMPGNIKNFCSIYLRFFPKNYMSFASYFQLYRQFGPHFFAPIPAKFLVGKCQSFVYLRNKRATVVFTHSCSIYN
jgi:hypothetical protein